MTNDISQLLNETEKRYNASFAHTLRMAIEARAWLLRLGLPFTLEALLRTTLREGFDKDSAFRGLDVHLTRRAANSVLPQTGTYAPAELSDEVTECLDTAGRISHHFSQTQYVSGQQKLNVQQGYIGQDAIVFAIAWLASELITSNIEPEESAEWIRKTAFGVARRALSERIGPSTMYNLTALDDIRAFLTQRSQLSNWRLKTFLARNVAAKGDRYAYMSVSEESEPTESQLRDELDEAPGSHASFCFVGVPQAINCPDWGEVSPPVRIESASCDAGEEGRQKFVLLLNADDARQAEISPAITIEFIERLTVEEYEVTPHANCQAD